MPFQSEFRRVGNSRCSPITYSIPGLPIPPLLGGSDHVWVGLGVCVWGGGLDPFLECVCACMGVFLMSGSGGMVDPKPNGSPAYSSAYKPPKGHDRATGLPPPPSTLPLQANASFGIRKQSAILQTTFIRNSKVLRMSQKPGTSFLDV